MSNAIHSGDGYVHPVKMDGTTDDIIRAILAADKCSMGYITDVTQFEAPTVLESCEKIFRFVRTNIPYNEDEEGVQWVQSPGELWSNRYAKDGGTGDGGDCKSMSIFCGALLKALGNFNFKYRFVSEEPHEELYHVYVIVMNDEGDGYITLDCTLKDFNRELDIAKYLDKDPAPADAQCPFPSQISGHGFVNQPVHLPTGTCGPHVGAMYVPGNTEAQTSGATWAAHEADFVSTCANNQQYHNKLQFQILTEISNHFANQPIKKQHAADFVQNNWDNHLKTWALMIYQYWGDSRLFLADFTKPIPPATDADIYVGTGVMSFKIGNGANFYNDLRNMGISDDSIFKVTCLSCYNNHGITLDYMLYRCYNKLTYGQEWGPLPGIPYYNANTGQGLLPNGATVEELGNIAAGFPMNGGTGVPWGTPYMAVGVFIMTNGASDADVKLMADKVNLLGWSGYINTYIYPGGTLTYNPATPAQIQAATEAYTNWQQGNLPVLYSNLVNPSSVSGPRIALAEAVIIALVIAIIQIVAAILSLILKFLTQTKTDQAALQANPPIAPADFKLQYQCADGCYIGYTSTCSNGVGKACKGAAFQCNPNLSLPANGPANSNYIPGTGTGGPGTGGPGTLGGSNKNLYIGLAALGVAAVLFSED